jgi:hypothetical protein
MYNKNVENYFYKENRYEQAWYFYEFLGKELGCGP